MLERSVWGGLVAATLITLTPGSAVGASAEENYKLYCVQCHGSLGNGHGINDTSGGLAVSPRNHTDPEEMSKLTDEDMRLAITHGGDAVDKSELMPAWGETLSAQEIDALVAYLRKLCKCVARR